MGNANLGAFGFGSGESEPGGGGVCGSDGAVAGGVGGRRNAVGEGFGGGNRGRGRMFDGFRDLNAHVDPNSELHFSPFASHLIWLAKDRS